MGVSKISVDLNERTFDLEVPHESLAHVLEQIAMLFDKLSPPSSLQKNDFSAISSEQEIDNSDEEILDNSAHNLKTKRKRSSARGPSKVRAYQLVELNLAQEQRLEMQRFFQEKSPKSQNDQVAVLAVKLKEMMKKEDFTTDEIHSAFKVVNKPTPKNLTAVFGNMKRDGRGGYVDNKLIVNSFTEDHVAFHMSKSEQDKK